MTEPLINLAEVFSKGRQLGLSSAESGGSVAEQMTLEGCWKPQGRNAGRLVLKIAGIDSISAAEALEGRTAYIRTEEMPALEEGTFFVKDLIGCELRNGEVVVGTIIDLQFPIAADGHSRIPDAADLFVVQSSAVQDVEPVLVPFVKDWLDTIDLDGKVIRMNLPPGLWE